MVSCVTIILKMVGIPVKHVGENIMNKIHHKYWGSFCWVFIYFRSDLYTADGTCQKKKILEIVEETNYISM